MKKVIWALLPFVLLCCESHVRPAPADRRVAGANELTDRYAHSRLADWKLAARAGGIDCDVLLVDTSVNMEQSMIEAMHYGAGVYGIYGGGVERFCRDRSFRGVVYRDPSGHVWTYGAVNTNETPGLRPCR